MIYQTAKNADKYYYKWKTKEIIILFFDIVRFTSVFYSQLSSTCTTECKVNHFILPNLDDCDGYAGSSNIYFEIIDLKILEGIVSQDELDALVSRKLDEHCRTTRSKLPEKVQEGKIIQQLTWPVIFFSVNFHGRNPLTLLQSSLSKHSS